MRASLSGCAPARWVKVEAGAMLFTLTYSAGLVTSLPDKQAACNPYKGYLKTKTGFQVAFIKTGWDFYKGCRLPERLPETLFAFIIALFVSPKILPCCLIPPVSDCPNLPLRAIGACI